MIFHVATRLTFFTLHLNSFSSKTEYLISTFVMVFHLICLFILYIAYAQINVHSEVRFHDALPEYNKTTLGVF